VSRISENKIAENVAALSSGDESAFRWLFDHYHNDILAYSIKLVKQKAQAEEITQDVFVKVWSHREKLNPNLSFKSFLFTITKNLCFNFLKKPLRTGFWLKMFFMKASYRAFLPIMVLWRPILKSFKMEPSLPYLPVVDLSILCRAIMGKVMRKLGLNSVFLQIP